MTTTMITLNVKECPTCGVVYGITQDFDRRRHEDGQRWFCPRGDHVLYRDTDVERLKRRIGLLENREADLLDSVKEAKTEARSAKANATRLKNRVKRGVCIYCNRTVKQMTQHVEQKHPEKVGRGKAR